MLEMLDGVNIVSITFRILLSVLLGGIIGFDRESINRPAGLRTHVLVCMGTAIAMITAQYIFVKYGMISDPARIGAQVVSGIGFLGAGSIIIDRKQVKGLTTAAGLWATACMGLAIGIGFYSAALIGGLGIFLTLFLLRKLSQMLRRRSPIMYLYIELDEMNNFYEVSKYFKENKVRIIDLEWSEKFNVVEGLTGVFVKLKLPEKNEHSQIMNALEKLPCVIYVSEQE